MKRFLALFLFSASLYAQTGTVSGTATDSDGQVWQNGSWAYEFYPAPNYPNLSSYFINGVPLSTYYSGPKSSFLDGSGHFSVTGVPRSDLISPAGSQIKFTICPQASFQCGSFTTPITSATNDLTTLINANIKAPRFEAVAGTWGYNDGETILRQPYGATYWNVIMLCQRYYDGTTWACNGTGGGGGGPSTIGLTTFGVNGPSTFNTTTKVLNVPNYGGLIGYTPSNGGGLILNVDSGVSFCLGVRNSYSAGTVGVNNGTTNYVYLAPATCNVTVNQTGYPNNSFPLAQVITSGGAITAIIDDRTPFNSVNTGGGGGGGASTVIQVNGIATTPTTPVNFSNSGPAAPTGNFLINFQQQVGAGMVEGYIPNYPTALPPYLSMYPAPPNPGQYTIVYPSGYTINDPSGTGTQANNTSAKLIRPYQTVGPTITEPSVNWTFTLPTGIVPANVTSVYCGVNWSLSGHQVSGGGHQNFFVDCNSPAGNTQPVSINAQGSPYPTQTAVQLNSNITGANFNSVNMTARFFGCGCCICDADVAFVNSIYLVVYYTGTPILSSTALNIMPPLTYNQSLNQLGVDPMFPYWVTTNTVGSLPATNTFAGRISQGFLVTDASTGSDCTVGGGTHIHWCSAPYGGTYTASGETGGGVTSIDAQTGAFVFTGSGVSHSGNTYTFGTGGSSMTYGAAWSGSSPYSPGAVVTYNGKSYLNISAITVATPTLVQSKTVSGTSATTASSVTAGDTLYAYTERWSSASPTVAPTDTLGTSFTQALNVCGAPNNGCQGIYVGIAPATGVDTVSIGAGGNAPSVSVQEWTAGPTTLGPTTSSMSAITGSLTTTATSLIITGWTEIGAVTGQSIAAPYTLDSSVNSGAGVGIAHYLQPSAGASTITWSYTGGTGNKSFAAASFQISSLSPDQDPTHWLLQGTNVTTKGDLQGFSTVPARIPVGTDGQVLTADSTQALGVKWAAALVASGGSPMTCTVVTGSRVLGTNYQNTTGNPLYVFVTAQSSGTSAAVLGYTDATTTPTTNVAYQSFVAINVGAEVAYIVPPTYYYRTTVNTGTPTLNVWTECSGGNGAPIWYNVVTQGGLDNTGVTDIGTGLASIISGLSSSYPRTLFFPAGTYKLNGGLQMSCTNTTCNGYRIVGEGRDSTIFTSTCTNGYVFWYNNTTNSGDNFKGMQMSDFSIDGQNNTACQDGIRLTQTSLNVIERVKIMNMPGNTYSTGTIGISGATVTGSGTTFTAAMVPGVIQVNGVMQEVCTFGSATSLTLCSTAWSKGTVAGGTAYALAYGGRGLTFDPGFSYTQYISVHDYYGANNMFCIYSMGTVGSSNGNSRISIDGKAGWCGISGSRITNSIGVWLGKKSDTFQIQIPVNNVSRCFVLESAHANNLNSIDCEQNATITPVTTCNGGVAAQSCLIGIESSADGTGTGYGNSYTNPYIYLTGTAIVADNINGGYNLTIMGLRSASFSNTNSYSFNGTLGCPANSSGVPTTILDWDCTHFQVSATVGLAAQRRSNVKGPSKPDNGSPTPTQR